MTLLIPLLAALALAACAVFDGPDDVAEDACRDSRDARSAACVEYMAEYFNDRVPNPKARPIHAAKAPVQYRADRFDCESTIFGSEGSTFGGDPSINEVRRYHTQMRRCLEDKHGWTFVPE